MIAMHETTGWRRVVIWVSCGEGGTTGQMSGADDSSFSGRAVTSV